MHHLDLPRPIAAYFSADRQDPDAVARCFTEAAVVEDEGRTHHGQHAIRTWKAAASAKYTYAAEPSAIEQHVDGWTVRAHVTGNFPGSPVDLRYRFRIERQLIASLEITS